MWVPAPAAPHPPLPHHHHRQLSSRNPTTTTCAMPPPKRPKTAYNARTKSATTLKKKIRDVRRILAGPIPADSRVENERALAVYQQDSTVATRSRSEHKIVKKYHMVRFFGTPPRATSFPPAHRRPHRTKKRRAPAEAAQEGAGDSRR